jgi:hypothetical protein
MLATGVRDSLVRDRADEFGVRRIAEIALPSVVAVPTRVASCEP